jgi:hypothetical protein
LLLGLWIRIPRARGRLRSHYTSTPMDEVAFYSSVYVSSSRDIAVYAAYIQAYHMEPSLQCM